MKGWQTLLLVLGILVGCGAIAAALALGLRYHYTPYPIDSRPARVDNFTGVVELYDKDRGWFDVRTK